MIFFVEVEDQKIVKPFLGGWRHKLTGTEYLNATSQTGPPAEKLQWGNRCSRTTQSAEIKDANTQSPCHRSTQMWRPDCFIPCETDTYLTIQPYETYEEMQLRLDFDGNARIIQRNYRVYRLLTFIKQSAKKYRERQENCRLYREEKLLLYRERHRKEILGKIYPTSREDFDMLYELIEKWRHDGLQKAKSNFFRAARCAENYSIVEKTIEMFKIIDVKRRALVESYRKKKRAKFLIINCDPIRWHGYKGKLNEMFTMKVQRARELRYIYNSLMNPNVTRDERIEILVMLKKSLEVHKCAAAFNLIQLLQRELVLLERELISLSSDRFTERIILNYLRFVRDFNDCGCISDKTDCRSLENEKLQEPPEIKTKLCTSCLKLLPHRRFAIHGRMKRLSVCAGCVWLRERNTSHVNYNPYLHILNCVCAEERRGHSMSALAFMMQKRDMYHLVNIIWHGHSIISKNNDLYALRLIRYRTDVEWSPWNCILLTEEEAEIHCRIKDLKSVYSKHLIDQISLLHQIAKNHFKHLSMLEKNFRGSSRYYTIQDRLDYKPSMKLEDYYFS